MVAAATAPVIAVWGAVLAEAAGLVAAPQADSVVRALAPAAVAAVRVWVAADSVVVAVAVAAAVVVAAVVVVVVAAVVAVEGGSES